MWSVLACSARSAPTVAAAAPSLLLLQAQLPRAGGAAACHAAHALAPAAPGGALPLPSTLRGLSSSSRAALSQENPMLGGHDRSRSSPLAQQQQQQQSEEEQRRRLRHGPEQHMSQLAADAGVELHPGLKKLQMANRDDMPKEYMKDLLAYDPAYLESVKPTHKPPRNLSEKMAYWAIQGTRASFDWATAYSPSKPQTELQWLRRTIFLETVAGVPGMVGGMLRHLRSLRIMVADKGWIATLLEEAENERMHLLTFLELRKPDWKFRAVVLLAQGLYFNMFFVSYLVAPKFCHAIVGYLEEEAVKTYTHLLHDIDAGHLWQDKPAPKTGISYWKLAPDAKMRDLILAIRADEASHSLVNHTLSEIPADSPNPFVEPGENAEKAAKHL